MIKESCFSKEWLGSFKKQSAHKKIDTAILERMIFAFHLLEKLKASGLNFVFKGGTSLVLLLDHGNRFSIDIDIICREDRGILEQKLNRVIENSRFNSFSLDERRSYQAGVPKAHYSFHYDSVLSDSTAKILLDVLIEDSIYPDHVEKAIQTKWIEVDEEMKIKLPSIDSITGDKLTAFAPDTIGIPYFKGTQSFAMEICKQLYDLSRLFERINQIEIVSKSFYAFAAKEIEYRRTGTSSTITPEIALQDTISTCLLLAKRGRETKDSWKFQELQKGLTAFGTGFLMNGIFRIEEAISAAGRVAYLAAKILKNDMSRMSFYNNQDIKELNIEDREWNFLNALKRQPDKSTFYYWYQVVQLLKNS